jgi:PPOX class probable FMN-dependent enzyme
MCSQGEQRKVVDQLRERRISTVDELHRINGVPHQSIVEKHTAWMTPLIEQFILASPFFLVATSDSEGNIDVSPKGDPAGTVRIIDRRTIVIPDRPGNRRIDGHRNIIANPHIGLIFIIPNVDETVRVNGRAFLSDNAELLESLEIQGKRPKLATVVEIDEVYMHCARAFLRSGLWKPGSWPDPDTVPTLGAIMCEQRELPPPDESAGKRNEEYRKILY